MKFLTEDFMLHNEYAKTLFHKYAKDQPIFDFHCHLEAQEIYENKNFDSITQVWLGGDHYKWRVMRAMGIEEELITGNGSDEDKFMAWAKTVPNLIGNPLYHWTHLELKNFFGIDDCLNEKNAKAIYDKCNKMLKEEDFKPRNLIERSNVKALCTTNDPIDDLKYHELLEKEEDFKVAIKPAFRPDAVLNIEKDDFKSYIEKLSKVSEIQISDLYSLEKALVSRIDFFEDHGCKASDHGLNHVPYQKTSRDEVNEILKKALNGEKITRREEDAYKASILTFLSQEYKQRDWVMEIHTGAIRNNSRKMFEELGADVGNDAINDKLTSENISRLLSDFEENGDLPRILLFTLNPKDFYPLSTIGGCFNRANNEELMNIQIGTAWWFLDHKNGMVEQMEILAQTSVFSKFVGMLTDSRSFLSYPRHEYFRRIMCNFIGDLVKKGEYPWDEEFLGQMVENISYQNAVDFIKIDI